MVEKIEVKQYGININFLTLLSKLLTKSVLWIIALLNIIMPEPY